MNAKANTNTNTNGSRRQSKLKRRRRVTATATATNNPLLKFAAGGRNANNSASNISNDSVITSTSTRVHTSAGDRGRKLSSKMNESAGNVTYFAPEDDEAEIAGADACADDNQNSIGKSVVDTFTCSSSSNVIMGMKMESYDEYPSVSNILNMSSELGSNNLNVHVHKRQHDPQNSILNHNCSDSGDGLIMGMGMGMGRKRLSAELDCFIENGIRIQRLCRKQEVINTRRRKYKQARISSISGAIHHSILGMVILNHDHDQKNDENDGSDDDDDDEDSMKLKQCELGGRDKGISPKSNLFQYVSPLAFPSLTKDTQQSKSRMDRPKWHHDELYHRGDGAVISCIRKNKGKHEEEEKDSSSTLLSFPMVGSKTKNGRTGINTSKSTRTSTMEQAQIQAKGMIKIVSKNGATIRQDFSIDEDQQAIGKLPFGAVRIYVDSEWLPPPPPPTLTPTLPLPSSRIIGVDDQSCGSDDGDDVDLEDTVLVGVMRYKVHLLPLDITDGKNSHMGNNMNVGPSTPRQFGWISDRSRLEDEPYVIGEIQN